MKKFLIVLLLWPSLAIAGGPKYTYPSPPSPQGLDDEMQNIYHNISYPAINFVNISSGTISFVNITSATVTNQLKVPNGSASNDAAAFGQIYYGFQTAIQKLDATNATTTSSTFQNTSLAQAITPTSSSHRILILVMGSAQSDTAGNVCRVTIARGAANLGSSHGFVVIGTTGATPVMMAYIDNPATALSTTYTVQIASADNSHTVEWEPDTNAQGIMILAEIQ